MRKVLSGHPLSWRTTATSAGSPPLGHGSGFDRTATNGGDAGRIAAVTQALLRRGFTDAGMARAMGGDMPRVLRAGIAPGRPV